MIFLHLASTVRLCVAVLAALGILAWHFYSVIFHPVVYPMNPAWMAGHRARRRVGKRSDSEEGGEAGEEDK